MTSGNAPLGRRDNGLYATDYAAVADVDPRVGEHLLDVLGDRGIAAYLKPTADEHPITRTALLPSRPMDRLYVDRGSLAAARRLLAEVAGEERDALETPERESDEFEAAWASIVAGYDMEGYGETASPDRPWPASEDLAGPGAGGAGTQVQDRSDDQRPDGSRPGDSRSGDQRPGDRRGEDTRDQPDPSSVIKPARPYLNSGYGSLLDGLDTFGAGLPDDEEEDFRPPPPPPLPRLSVSTVVGVLAILAGMIALISPGLISVLSGADAQLLGGVSVLVGAVMLIARLRPGSDEDEPDDPDHGAII